MVASESPAFREPGKFREFFFLENIREKSGNSVKNTRIFQKKYM